MAAFRPDDFHQTPAYKTVRIPRLYELRDLNLFEETEVSSSFFDRPFPQKLA